MILVIGASRLGSNLALKLTEAGHPTTVLEHDRDMLLANIPPEFKGRVIHGLEIDPDVLERAGVREANTVAVVTRDDNTNAMCADVVRHVFGKDKVVVRLDQPRLARLYQEAGFLVISPINEGTSALMDAVLQTKAN